VEFGGCLAAPSAVLPVIAEADEVLFGYLTGGVENFNSSPEIEKKRF
jgi:hypothetical protein